MSDYETFRQWAAEAADMIANHGDDYLRTWCWQSPLKAAFMTAILLRRQLKREIDGIRGHGLAYQAMTAMNELDEAAYGYIDHDDYDDDYPSPGSASGDASYLYSGELRQRLNDAIAPAANGLASVWRCEAQTAESAPERTVSIGTVRDARELALGDIVEIKAHSGRISIPLNKSGAINLGTLKDGDDVTFDPSPDSGVVRQMTDEAMAYREWQERYERAVKGAMLYGTRSFTVPAGTTVTAEMLESLTWPNSPSYYTPEQEEMIVQGNRIMEFMRLRQIPMDDAIAMGEQMAEQLCGRGWDLSAVGDAEQASDHQSPLDAIGEDVLNTVIAPAKQGQATSKPQAHTDPYFSEDEQRDMEPVEVWCKPKTGKAYRHCVRPRKAAEELVERNNSQYRGVAEYWIEP